MTPVSPQRVRSAHVQWVRDRLSQRDLDVLQTLGQLHVARGSDLERLHFYDLDGRSRSVVRWRVLKRLVDWRVLRPLPRRVGGSLAGSASLVFTLDSTGWRLLRGTNDHQRRPLSIAERAVPHRLGVTALYVDLVELTARESATVEAFVVEPECWVPDHRGSWLKPDAYVRLASGEVVDHWWLEHDRATEDRRILRAKIDAYLQHLRLGHAEPTEVMPRVLFSVPDSGRTDEVLRAVRQTTAPADLFHVATHDVSAEYMTHQLSVP